ncbi:dihydrolipoyl dehydrogenase [Deinococcus wulumuqiensis]|uniref:Dihydrolipoyl dehydrogenase n=1 Tax=Deinococcus wulumuqiensis TaxID=980427 RepID=A0AAV4K9I1_9DEIO|nr:dihydrolipoyl dehydrogenase [Deinococcus wulumuqiensis]QII21535.1 dihydrolipoyl dehydrogenase [Deinococcus wulumuqiensis R12]GGI84107.1 dihydrolipoyl dehydrogenase [Deinococcus wulumuqiensis]GGP29748.1 dihydrolipoyl dehydrogenase [Deinococcus wulumuqiensis]
MTNNFDYDVLVIGAGPGGYHAAIRASQLGLKVACVERGAVGGVCLNIGCIPTKALLHAAEMVHASHRAAEFGLTFADTNLNIAKLNGWKDGIVKKLTGGVSGLFKANKVTLLTGQASFVDDHTVSVDGKNYTAAHFIIATGSDPAKLPGLDVDQDSIVDSTGALVMPDPVPARMLCVGGGVIGFEFAQVYNNLGSKVKIIEFLPTVIPGADADAVKEFAKVMSKQGIEIVTQMKANRAEKKADGVHVELENVKTGEKTTEVFDRVLVAVGRRPRTDGLNAEKAGVTVTERGFIPADKQQRTNVPHIFSIGDVASNPMLAHKAMKEGLVAAEVIAGKPAEQDAVAIPGVVYTNPELAWVGLTEQEAKDKGYEVKTGVFPMSASGRAMTLQSTDGFVKMVVEKDTDLLLGVHIVAPHASDMLAEAGLALEMAATATDISLTIHAHPTLGESMLEAAEAAHKQAIHIVNR